MLVTRSLLLKGLGGAGALVGVGGLVLFREDIFGVNMDLSSLNHRELIDKVGLNCQLTNDDIGTDTKECSVKDGGKINVKRGSQVDEEVSYSGSETPKLKVSKSEEGGYTNNLKFVVDSGDITLTKDGASPDKLEQFETYEITAEKGGKFYLTRKTEAKEGKIRALELPTGNGKCTLPENGKSDCTLTVEEAKKVKFDGVTNGQQINLTGDSPVALTITKMEDATNFGEDNHRFTFTFPSEVTINSKSYKTNTPYDFKIKKGNGNTLTLEKAWSEDNAFAKKAGLDCSTDTDCSISSNGQKLNVKVGESKKEEITNKTGSGKIKMEKEKAGYNQGIKFSITTGEVGLTNGTGSADITKLEELETYEITEEGGKYHLTKKTGRDDHIRTSLVLPRGCDLPSTTSTTCSMDSGGFKAINFSGKSSSSFEGQKITLTISKANATDFPLGYRFTFSADKEATIVSGNTIKANTPTDFKIKKTDGSNDISLEKAWTETKFAEKVGLTCASGECCSKGGSEKLNVRRGEARKTDISSISTGTEKIKVEKDQEGYNQGLKFTIAGGDVTLTGGTASGTGSLEKLEELETYEITKEGDKYYLTRKTEAAKTIGSLLGLPSGCSLSSSSCSLTTQDLQKINFGEKDSPTGTATLEISRENNNTSEFPLGYKFILKSSQDITIKSSTNIVKANTNTEFKIKKADSGVGLSLERAWDMTTFSKKVNLTCNNSNGNECTIGNSLKVMQGENKETNLSKNTSSSSSGKIKVEKDQEGYNQGFKFTISEGSIALDGSTKAEEDEKIKSLDEYETYEIKEEEGNWYLVRKDKAQVFIKKQLGLEFCTGDFPNSAAPLTCEIEDVDKLKGINFDDKNNHKNWPSTVSGVQLEINKESSLPGGFKFTFNECSGPSCCLPGSSKAETDSSGGLIYKIKKSNGGGTICLEPKPKNGGSSRGGSQCTK